MRSTSLICLVLSIVTAVSFGGCTVPITEVIDPSEYAAQMEYKGYSQVDESLLDFSHGAFEKVKNRQNYDALDTDELRRCYECISREAFYIEDKKSENGYAIHKVGVKDAELKEGEIRTAITAFLCDNPEVFWIDGRFEYLVYDGETKVYLYSQLCAADVISQIKKLREASDEIIGGITAEMSEYERELYIHDRIIELCEYDDTVTHDSKDFRAFTVLGPILDGRAICEGYSRAFQFLLSLVGIESNCVYGVGENDLHMWNSLKLSDEWYYTDVTWDDGDGGKTYAYFNLSDDLISGSHTVGSGYRDMSEEEMNGEVMPDPFNVAEFSCNDDSMNYYRNSAVCVSGYEDSDVENIEDAIVDSIEEPCGERAIVYLYIDEETLDFEDAVNNLFYSGDYLIFECIDGVNSRLENVSVDKNKVSLIKYEKLCGITVFFGLEYIE